jgi:hypothetical protein
MRRHVLMALATAAIVGLVGLLAASPAAAAAHGYANKLNMYEDHGYKGHLEARTSYDRNLGNDQYGSLDHSFNDAASSVSNRTGAWWRLYRDKGALTGPYACIRPRSQVSDLKTYKIGDWISSVKKGSASKPSGCSKTIGTSF